MLIGFIFNATSTGCSRAVKAMIEAMIPEVAKLHSKLSKEGNIVAVTYLKAQVLFWAYCIYAR